MSDLIRRSDAIDAIFGRSHEIIKMRIGNLPSAHPQRCEDCANFSKTRLLIPQPEIIRCKDCKNSDWYTTVSGERLCYCMEHGSGGHTENDYCSYAEKENR